MPLIFNSILGVFPKSPIGFPRWMSALLGDVESPLTPRHRLSSAPLHLEIPLAVQLQHPFLSEDSLLARLLGIHPTLRALGRLCCHFDCPGYKEVCPQKQGLEQWSHCSARGCDITMAEKKQGWGRQNHPKLLAAFNFVWCMMNETLTLNCTSRYHLVAKKSVSKLLTIPVT